MARAIDGELFAQRMEQWKKDCLQDDDQYGADIIADVLLELSGVPTLTQPNEPMTLEELRMIVEPTPIWWDWVHGWVLVKQGVVLDWNERYHNAGGLRGDFYRRPPEGEEEK